MRSKLKTKPGRRKPKSDFFVIRRDLDTSALATATDILKQMQNSRKIAAAARQQLTRQKVKRLAIEFCCTFVEDLDVGNYRLPVDQASNWLLDVLRPH